MELVVAALVSVIVGVFIKELLDCLPWLSRRIVAWRAKRINKIYRNRILRDFLADLESMDSRIGQIVLAIGFLFQDWSDIPTVSGIRRSSQKLDEEDKGEDKFK